ncbi:hypothetical protein LTR05_003440 [Lithohypha guttulata]|uniref:DUF8004 domain-containing protein n=1 Tax=Lithohypha guttulata TaxID=1690604 RepID=A0AAN7T750_9EURO|nr:hypothetical protein LTR05_003440 [Lithohypha guttulata]
MAFDHFLTTRNVFAWLYNVPLAGRSLGTSLVALKERLDEYRPCSDGIQNKKELLEFASSQKYLDFFECEDHAMAALLLAENLRLEDMWIDAFVHTVGMSHRDIHSSLEYHSLSPITKSLILESRIEMDVRIARASVSIETFFGDDLSGNFLGLSEVARDHFDRFRSFLHAFYIDRYGFWPPAGFSSEAARYKIYAVLYTDFRNLYHHLVDPESSSSAEAQVSNAGGICVLQNIECFDNRHGFKTLPRPLPQLPQEPTDSLKPPTTLSRRKSWNPVTQKKIDKENKQTQRKQALIDASNRDLFLMDCQLVPWVDGRKTRFLLVYAILQTLISIMAVPEHVRSKEGLTYSLCCHVPVRLPWMLEALTQDPAQASPQEIVPDIDYIHTNLSTTNLDSRAKERRLTMPANPLSSLSRSSSMRRVTSLKRLLSRRSTTTSEEPPVPALHCEILVQGYGNGLHSQSTTTLPTRGKTEKRKSLTPSVVLDDDIFSKRSQHMPHSSEYGIPSLSPTSSASVSRETSNASSISTKTKSTVDTDDLPIPSDDRNTIGQPGKMQQLALGRKSDDAYIYDEIEGLPGSIHINTKTWDEILSI